MLLAGIINAGSEVHLILNRNTQPARAPMLNATPTQTPDHAHLAARGRALQARALRSALASLFQLPARLAARGQVLDGPTAQKA